MGYWKIITPYATTNLITNPSFENNTHTGWVVDGTNTELLASEGTVGTDRTNVKFGMDSWRILYVDDLDLARYTITLPSAQQYTFSMWVYLNDGTEGKAWDGGAVRLNVENFTSSTINTASTTCSTNGVWTRLQITFTPDAGDLTGDLVVEAASAPTSNDGRYVYLDAAQCEAGAYATTYCDGDQPGCEWSGVRNSSTSTRPASTRLGGRIQDLGDDFGFPVERMIGTGLAQIKNLTAQHLFAPGSAYQGHTIQDHSFTLVSRINGTTMADYHSQRQALLSAIAPDDEPVTLRYTGTTIHKEIGCRYVNGMTMTGPNGFSEVIALEFMAAEQPHFTEIGNHAQYLSWYDSDIYGTSYDGIMRYKNGAWDKVSHTTGETNVYAMAYNKIDGKLYIGGNFTNWNGNANADYFARWDGTSWEAIGTGMDGPVYSIVVTSLGDVLVGGAFTTAGGVAHPGLVVYDLSTSGYVTVGSPSSGGTVRAIAIHPLTGDIVIGGSFTNWDGQANCDAIARYNRAVETWHALGTGISGGGAVVYALAYDRAGGLYIGGDFTTVNGSACDSLTYYSGSFSSLSSSTDGAIRTIFVDDNGLVYIGGTFGTIGAESGHTLIVVWNGSQFSDLGAAPKSGSGGTSVLAVAKWRDMLIVGGQFIGMGSGGLGINDLLIVPLNYALWNGSDWAWIDGSADDEISCVAVKDGDEYYLGGEFTAVSGRGDRNYVTVGGTAKVYPKIVLKVEKDSAPGYGMNYLKKFWNETTRKMVHLDDGIWTGDELIIDFFPDNISAESVFEGRIWPFVPGSNLTDMYLLPGQTNLISCKLSYPGGLNLYLAPILWKEAYWSID